MSILLDGDYLTKGQERQKEKGIISIILISISFILSQVDSKEAVSQVLSGVKPQAKKTEKKPEKPKEKEKPDKATDRGKKGVMFSSRFFLLKIPSGREIYLGTVMWLPVSSTLARMRILAKLPNEQLISSTEHFTVDYILSYT